MLLSEGVQLKSAPTTVWRGTPSTWDLQLSGWWSSYAEIYRKQLWVYVTVRKLAAALARLPLKTYVRDGDNRPEAPQDDLYRLLLERPSSRWSPYQFWAWTDSTRSVYGEAFWLKERDRGGRPIELLPLHPTGMTWVDADSMWEFRSGNVQVTRIRPDDVVHLKDYNPSDERRGLSPLEPLRATLENEDAARRATSAFWKNGGRPSMLLKHPARMAPGARDTLKVQWDAIHGSVDNFAKTAILEDGMEAQFISVAAEEMQYIETRKLNREEVAAAYDIPPPVIHILERSTFNNIVELMRSLYRDTIAPRCGFYEAELEQQLRGAVNPRSGEPDFGAGVYAEFKMDEVLRGAFEQRVDAYNKGIQAGWLEPAEVRRFENLPAVEGSDRLFINSTIVPLDSVGAEPAPAAEPLPPALSEPALRTVMGRLSRVTDLTTMHPGELVAGLNGTHKTVLAELEAAKAEGLSVPEFRDRLKAIAG